VLFFLDTSVAGSSPIVKWDWNLGHGGHIYTQSTQFLYPAKGKYTISLTVTDKAGRTDTKVKTDYIEVYSGCSKGKGNKDIRKYVGEFFLLGVTLLTLLGLSRIRRHS
jgi:PKD repeat protein